MASPAVGKICIGHFGHRLPVKLFGLRCCWVFTAANAFAQRLRPIPCSLHRERGEFPNGEPALATVLISVSQDA
jgi:hypothetical protein